MGYNTPMTNTPAQLLLFNVTTRGPFGYEGFVLAAYDEEDARDEVREFLGERMENREFEPVLFLGLAQDEIEHGMIMHHSPDFI